MKFSHAAAALALSVALTGAGMAQTTYSQDNAATRDDLKQDQRDLHQAKKADKAQSHADHEERKALKSKKVRKADAAQAHADHEAEKVPPPQQ